MASLTPNSDSEVKNVPLGITQISWELGSWGATGIVSVPFTVPVGKRWVLKGVRYSTGTATLATMQVKITIDSKVFTILDSTLTTTVLLDNDIVLIAGDVVDFVANVSTDGTSGRVVMYEESSV